MFFRDYFQINVHSVNCYLTPHSFSCHALFFAHVSYSLLTSNELLSAAVYCELQELSMESGIDPGQEYYGQDYYSYEHGYFFSVFPTHI